MVDPSQGVALAEREISAQTCPVSVRERAASRTTGPHHFFRRSGVGSSPAASWRARKNRDPHRRSAVAALRSAILDPTRSLPGGDIVFLKSGGDDGALRSYPGTAGRAVGMLRCGRGSTDRTRIGCSLDGVRAAGGNAAVVHSRRTADRLRARLRSGGCGVDEAPCPPFFLSSLGKGNGRRQQKWKERRRWRDKSSAGLPTLCGWEGRFFVYGTPAPQLAPPAIFLGISTHLAAARQRNARIPAA